MEVLFETSSSQVGVDTDSKLLYLILKGQVDLSDYQATFLNLLEQIKKYNYTNHLYDLSAYQSNSMMHQKWYLSQFLPKCYRETNQEFTIAMISPTDSSHKIAIQTSIQLAQKMNYPFEIHFFDSFGKAENWLSLHLPSPN